MIPKACRLKKCLVAASILVASALHSFAALPEASDPFAAFYSKQLDDDGIIIRASQVVSDDALAEAKRRIDRMLEHLPAVRANLRNAGAELHIVGKDQAVSDLPEYAHLKGKPFDGKLTVDERTRGLGGVWTSCGEENLLRLPNDRYRGRDILIHEFAHDIFGNGIPESFRKRIEQQYHDSLAAGRWGKAYAATNPNEFFAELGMWYFGTHGDRGMTGEKPKDGPDGLREYDPDSFALLDDFYQGRIAIPATEYTTLPVLPVAQAESLRSKNAESPSNIIFHNQTGRRLNLFWIGYDGSRKQYGELAPHAVETRSTFGTHPWLCVDEADKPVALFIARAGGCIANIVEQ